MLLDNIELRGLRPPPPPGRRRTRAVRWGRRAIAVRVSRRCHGPRRRRRHSRPQRRSRPPRQAHRRRPQARRRPAGTPVDRPQRFGRRPTGGARSASRRVDAAAARPARARTTDSAADTPTTRLRPGVPARTRRRSPTAAGSWALSLRSIPTPRHATASSSTSDRCGATSSASSCPKGSGRSSPRWNASGS